MLETITVKFKVRGRVRHHRFVKDKGKDGKEEVKRLNTCHLF